MEHIASISEFLLQAGTEYRVFDMGRTLHHTSSQTFLEIENGKLPAPFPRAGHAWFGVIFWNKHLSGQHYIWFLKLPLDEQGKVVSASRNHYLQIIVDALGQSLEQAEEKQGQLPENPYSFVPNQQQLADFNSVSRVFIGVALSEYFEAAASYFAAPGIHDWRTLSIQGVSDVVAQWGKKGQLEQLAQGFTQLPDEVRYPLLTSLENQSLPVSLVESVGKWLRENPDNIAHWQHGLRALSQSSATGLIAALVDEALSSPLGKQQDVLIIFAGRLWQHLTDEPRLKQYLQNVCAADPSFALFKGLYSDLVQIPEMRPHLLAMLRWTDKSAELTAAVGHLFGGR